MLKDFGCPIPIEMVRRKHLNVIVEQDSRFIKRRTRPLPGFKSFASASATLAGIEVAHMIGKRQFTPIFCPFQQFAELAAFCSGMKTKLSDYSKVEHWWNSGLALKTKKSVDGQAM
ncbi:DDE domain-containing protein [Ruegeria halocynthiae]|uniref:DDE domain-containing protein n=1 Tax=Ruegeria halocynthiae TaxID=985054 RepID=A0A1H2ZNV6_9RHOB|nr:DDE domain-containing protein [Ruegeria halocynthiae]